MEGSWRFFVMWLGIVTGLWAVPPPRIFRQIFAVLDCLTSHNGENFGDFVSRVLEKSLAARVKIRDIADNVDVTRLGDLTDADVAQRRK